MPSLVHKPAPAGRRARPARPPRAHWVFAAVVLALLFAPPAAAKNAAPPIDEDLWLVTVEGEELTFGELRGKVVLLDFWTTWCGPCRAATPHLRRIAGHFSDKPFVLIGISGDRDLEVVEAFLENEEMEWPQVWDGRGKIRGAFGVRSYPTYLLIDHEGRPASVLRGWSSGHSRALTREIGRGVRRAVKAEKRAARGSS